MSDTLQTVVALAGLVPVVWCAFWLAFGTLNAVAEGPSAKTSLHFTGFLPNAFFLACFVCAGITLAGAL